MLDRAIATIVGLLVIAVLLPTITALTAGVIPSLIAVLVLLFLLRLIWPRRRQS